MSNDLEDLGYFDSYSDLNIHRTMLNDKQRLHAYKKAIFSNTEFWKDKVVLDVGAGTGILSIYCAKAGASKVYAVEANRDIFDIMNKIVAENDVGNIVETVAGRIEDVNIMGEVDAIVSEWMGHYLLHESMLNSVIYARDKYLKADGLIFPAVCRLYASPCALPDYFDYWDDVTGVVMTSFGRALREQGCSEICTLSPNLLFCDECSSPVYEFNTRDVTADELRRIEKLSFTVARADGLLQGVCVWFDVLFPPIDPDGGLGPVILSTSPFSPETHWKQFVVVLPVQMAIEQGYPIAISLTLQRDSSGDDGRKYNISLEIVDPDDIEHPEECYCLSTKCSIIRQYRKNNPQ